MRETLSIFHFNLGRDLYYTAEDNGLEAIALWRLAFWKLLGLILDLWAEPKHKGGDNPDEIPF